MSIPRGNSFLLISMEKNNSENSQILTHLADNDRLHQICIKFVEAFVYTQRWKSYEEL